MTIGKRLGYRCSMPRGHLSARALLVCGVLLSITSVVLLGGLQYFMPPTFDNPPGVNQAGIVHFQSVLLTRDLTPLSVPAFVRASRFLIVASWIGYGMMLFSSYRYRTDLGRHATVIAASSAALVALLFPPSLSSDVYAYAGWGRMLALHGWNPYAHTLQSLAELGDPAGLVAPVPASSTHGPVWVGLVAAVVSVLRSMDLWVQIVALKLLAGMALLAAALGARLVAGSYDKGKAELAFLAVGFNPLFLVEGPGSGHNDVLMAALMLGGIALCNRGRSAGYLLLGLSAGIKFVTAAIVPWVIWEQVARLPASKRLGAAALATSLALAPNVIGHRVFSAETGVFEGIRTVFERQTVNVASTGETEGIGAPPARSVSTSMLMRGATILLIYVLLTLAIWRTKAPGFYLSCWSVFSMTVMVFAAPVLFPWYIVWPFSTAVIRWDRLGAGATLACAVLALVRLVQYTVPYVR